MDISLEIWKNASANHGSLWMLYILVVSAVLGFSFSEHFARVISECEQLGWATLAALVIFMASNIYSLVENMQVMEAARTALLGETTDASVEKVIKSTAPSKWLVVALHLVLDGVIAFGLFYRIKRRPHKALESDAV